ncbi:Rieske (2Fe-2S) protein [Halovenus carboxidivorans]|uniref:Rieske (2Fe-2S) protein n=1 Tax=Halovenus carboxidivorans TaxID=2692199 RepID=UPI0034A10E47
MATRLTSVDTVHAEGSWLFTATDDRGETVEVTLVPCGDGVEAWVNRCTHEDQRLDRGEGIGAVLRDGGIVCPKHGSVFDACDGGCENGPAAGSTLLSVQVSVNRGDVFLTDDDYEFDHQGGRDDDEGPSSTSHLRF